VSTLSSAAHRRLRRVCVLLIALALLGAGKASTDGEIWVTIVEPTSDSFVIGKVAVVAEVVAAEDVAEVEFYVDGKAVGLVTSPPYSIEVDLGEENIGHRFSVIARDVRGAHATHFIATESVPIARDFDVELQQLYVTVTAGSRRVLDLGAEDFVVRDNEDEQKITTFANGDLPFTAALLIDASASMHGERLAHATAGAAAFVRGMNILDQAKLLVYSHQLLNTTPFTGNRDLLTTGLSGAEASGGTALHDHLYLALKLLQERQGRRVLILLSDGVDSHSVLNMDQLYQRARQSQVVIYWIRLTREAGGAAPDEPGVKMWSAWRDADEFRDQFSLLQQTVDDSGGRTIRVDKIQQVERTFVQILQELREQYVLGYYPSNRKDDGTWHRIRVKVNRRGTEVRTHRGYVDF
jgi:Ca-activated chloride channel family protein